MEENKLEEELLRSFSRIFYKIGQYSRSKDENDLKRIKQEILNYNKFEKEYKGDAAKYSEIIDFTLNELDINLSQK